MSVRHCVMIPFFNRHEQVVQCIQGLLVQALPETLFLLVDDASAPGAMDHPGLKAILHHHKNVHLIRHKHNSGVAAARNSGIDWCRKHDIEILVMMDSDCRPGNHLIAEHLRLHREHPDAVCIGGRINGEGKGVWARLDGITSWVHASPHGVGESTPEFRAVGHPYHLATTNFSVKLGQLPPRPFVFDERLMTGEDCFLIRELRKSQKGIYFSASPEAFHQDRETFLEVFRHHYVWGHHQYFIQLGGDISPRCFNALYRCAFVLIFLPLIPVFALAGSVLNSRALWVQQRKVWGYYPLIYLLWLGKGCAVVEAAIRPYVCLRAGRSVVEYEEPVRNG